MEWTKRGDLWLRNSNVRIFELNSNPNRIMQDVVNSFLFKYDGTFSYARQNEANII